MIQDMCRDPDSITRLREEAETVFSEYQLDENEKAALRTGDPLFIVSETNAHPILAMHYLFVAKPEVMEQMSLNKYPQLLVD